MINNKPLKAQRQKDRQKGIEREVEAEALLIGLCSLVGSLYILDYFVHILGFSSWSHMYWVFFFFLVLFQLISKCIHRKCLV